MSEATAVFTLRDSWRVEYLWMGNHSTLSLHRGWQEILFNWLTFAFRENSRIDGGVRIGVVFHVGARVRKSAW